MQCRRRHDRRSVLSSLLNLSLPPVHTILDTDFYGAVEQFEKQLIEEALTSCGSLRKSGKEIKSESIHGFTENKIV